MCAKYHENRYHIFSGLFEHQSLTRSADCSFQTPEPETPSPEPKEEEADVTQQTTREEKLERSLDSYSQLTADDKKHNNNNNNMLACK